ncbi:P-loop containing nucleoside triphosphate hydrolase protein [Leucosporidium creatinivorum]|uniref:p-loop containing nucleoside triphosphate hydrolase protein n=1 Tax=Leucosporidium creatinivorum TaxID=106004 RepID=A0A1Y2FW74_9BASI|nr:P-loop containing nucleoside triphosphate hydrolase protein [Leucosporidium creatinivorum]
MVLKKVAAKKAAAAAAASTTPSTSSTSHIKCSAQQSRFHAATLDTTTEVDIKDLTISVGEKDLLASAHLRLKNGVRYGLVGRNGTGKSSIFTALSEGLIPGLSPSLRILLLSQVEDSTRASEDDSISVLEHVVRGDKQRFLAVRRQEALLAAVESTSLVKTEKIVYTLQLEDRRAELVRAQLTASRRSGTRGKEAREEELKAEARVKEAEERLEKVGNTEPDAEIVSTATDMLNDVQATLELLETSSADARAATILHGLGFSYEMMEGRYSALSGGWRSRCSLATALLVQSDVVLLDEVTNFLDLEATIWLEKFLVEQTGRTLVVVSHDQSFLSAVVEETIILRNSTFRYFEGTPTAFEVNERKERKRLLGAKEALDKKRDHIEKSIQQGITSAKKTGDENRQRMVKSRQRKLDERFGVETSAKGTRFKLNRDLAGYHLSNRAELAVEEREGRVKINIPQPEKLRTIEDLLHFDNVQFSFPKATTPLLADVTFTVEQGGRVAFVGANGQGKTTLAKLIVGELQPTKGKIVRHPLLRIGYFSQHSVEDLSLPISSLSLNNTPVTALSYFLDHFEAKGEKVLEQEARALLGSLGLQGDTAARTPLSQLSGGQKVRLAFALIVFHPPPLLLLDEVTTHVDAPTIKALALALKSYAGAIVLITHDRWFSRVVVENESFRQASGIDAEDEEDEESSESEEEGGGKKGMTWRVGGGKIKLMEKGMAGYVGIVERKLARRKREEEAAGK